MHRLETNVHSQICCSSVEILIGYSPDFPIEIKGMRSKTNRSQGTFKWLYQHMREGETRYEVMHS